MLVEQVDHSISESLIIKNFYNISANFNLKLKYSLLQDNEITYNTVDDHISYNEAGL